MKQIVTAETQNGWLAGIGDAKPDVEVALEVVWRDREVAGNRPTDHLLYRVGGGLHACIFLNGNCSCKGNIELPHPVKIVVPGNHEFLLEGDDQAPRRLSNATLLINRGVEACGLRIWGSPVTALSGGAFGLSSIPDRRRVCRQIPKGTDILVTHGPPHGILDCEDPGAPHSGCPVL